MWPTLSSLLTVAAICGCLWLSFLWLCLQEGAARPEIIAEVASSLADMLYATNKLEGAKEALQVSGRSPACVLISCIQWSIDAASSTAALVHTC